MFPVLPVELADRQRPELLEVLKATGVYAPAVGLDARMVEGMDAAVPAEQVRRGASPELVYGKLRLSSDHTDLIEGQR